MKSLLLPFVCAAQLSVAQGVSLDSLIGEAVRVNPELAAAQARVAMSGAHASTQAALPDPVLSFRYRESEVGLTQMVPFPTKLALTTRVAKQDRALAEEFYQATKLKIIKDVKASFFDLYYLNHALAIVQQNHVILNGFSKILEARYAAGLVPQSELLTANVQLSKFVDRETNLEQMRQEAEARLNRLLARASDSAIGEMNEPAEIKFNTNQIKDLRQQAQANRPELVAAQEQVKKNDAIVTLSRWEYFPDFDIGVSYMVNEKMYNAMIGISLPIWWWRKQHPMVKEALAEKTMNQHEYQSMVAETDFMVTDLVSKIDKNDKLATLYRTTIIPQARQAYEGALTDYQSNKVDFLMVLDNLMTTFMYEDEYYMKRSEFFKDLAELETIIGERIY